MNCSNEDFREIVSDLNESLHEKMPDSTEDIIFFYYWENKDSCGIKLTIDRKFRTTIPLVFDFPSYKTREDLKEVCYKKLEEIENLLCSIKETVKDSSEGGGAEEWFDI